MTCIFIQRGDEIDYTPAANVAAGALVLVGDKPGVAKFAIPAGETGALSMRGVFDVEQDGSAAVSVGDAIYWDASAGKATKTASTGTSPNVTNNTRIGTAVAAAASGADTVRVLIG